MNGGAGSNNASHVGAGDMGPAPDSVPAMPVDQGPNPYLNEASSALKGLGAAMAGGPIRGISLPKAVASPIQLSALPISQIHL